MTLRAVQLVASVHEEATGPGCSVLRLAESLAEGGVNSEIEDFKNFGLNASVAAVPNGIEAQPLSVSQTSSEYCALLYLGRIHPMKGLNTLLYAFRALIGICACAISLAPQTLVSSDFDSLGKE